MNTVTPLVLDPGNGASGRVACGITIVYEDVATALRAKKFSDLLIEVMGGDTDCKASYWRSSLLGVPEVEEEIARNPSAGEFLIVSLRGDTTLSTVAIHTIKQWLKTSADHSLCMVALFDFERCNHPAAFQTRKTLQSLAAAAGIALFTHFFAHETSGESPFHTHSVGLRADRENNPDIIASYLPVAAMN